MGEALGTSFAISEGILLGACRAHAWVIFSSPSSDLRCAERVALANGLDTGWQLCGSGNSASSPRFKLPWAISST